jgi:transcriptional regulator with XRE-family HTH domain/ribosomal protein S18 acetylase RimI-like enzyme
MLNVRLWWVVNHMKSIKPNLGDLAGFITNEDEVEPRPRRRDKKGGVGPLRIEQVDKSEAARIAAWVSRNELFLVGGTPERQVAIQVKEWMERQLGGFILKAAGEPVAFINLEPFGIPGAGSSACELGRLIVHKPARDAGYGTALTRHVLLNTWRFLDKHNDVATNVVMRVRRENDYGIRIVRKLPLRAFSRAEPIDPACEWFLPYDRQRTIAFGRLVRSLRREMSLSQKELAFYCAVSASMINAIESGTRHASYEVLQKLISVLGVGRKQFELISAYIAEETPRLLIPQSLEETLAEDDEDLWVISDVVGETFFPQYLDRSVSALRKQRKRYFFVPTQDVATDLKRSFGQMLDGDLTKYKLRVYVAPKPLCNFRIAIRSPENRDTRSGTLSGGGFMRIPIDRTVLDNMTEDIMQVIGNIEITSGEKIQGFTKFDLRRRDESPRIDRQKKVQTR